MGVRVDARLIKTGYINGSWTSKVAGENEGYIEDPDLTQGSD